MLRRLALSLPVLSALTLSVPALAQTADAPSTPAAPATTGTTEPAAAAPTETTTPAPAPATTTAPPPKEETPQVDANGKRIFAPGERAAIPQTDERPYVRSPQMKKMMQKDNTWDMNLELGYGRVFRDPAKWEGFFRGGAGIMFVRDPIWEVFRFTYDYSPRSTATMGFEFEADWIETGLWGQLGILKDANSPYWGGRASLGFALFGIDAEYRGDATTQTYFALYGKLRIPIGILGRALR